MVNLFVQGSAMRAMPGTIPRLGVVTLARKEKRNIPIFYIKTFYLIHICE